MRRSSGMTAGGGPSSAISVVPASLDSIAALRQEYRAEMASQVVHDSWHERGFVGSYLLHMDGQLVGYGSVGGSPGEPRETIKEFYLRPPFRGAARPLFRALIQASGARRIAVQSNDTLLFLMLLDCAPAVSSPTILFADGLTTGLAPSGARFRRLSEDERKGVFAHSHEPVGEYGLALGNRIVATGGIAYHYNPPFGDLYMEVDAPYRRQGLGSYLVQELKRVCYEAGCVPGARCSSEHIASRCTLERAGMFPTARILEGTITL